MSMVFQLPHCVEKAAFPLPQKVTGRMKTPWAEHQVQTAVNYSRSNPLLSWFVGGLNFQIEHHLFPRICHVHYAALAPLVEKTCQEFGINYQANETFRSAIASHFRWLRRMGPPALYKESLHQPTEARFSTRTWLIAPPTKYKEDISNIIEQSPLLSPGKEICCMQEKCPNEQFGCGSAEWTEAVSDD
jgi:Fatty acid desaturase